MRLRHKEALSILDISGTATHDQIKTAYRRACSMYHPDRNPAGLEMMKIINGAYQSLSDYVSGSIDTEDENWEEQVNLADELSEALNAIQGLGLTIEICGSWIWVSGNTKPHKDVLKGAGYKWASKKLMWHFRPADSKSWSRGKYSMDEIRNIHGSVNVRNVDRKRIAA